MNAVRILLPLTITAFVFSCSKPDSESRADSEPGTEVNRKSTTADVISRDQAATLPSPKNIDAQSGIETLAKPNLEPTGPVHESPGVVDNREAQVAFDILKMEQSEAKSLALTELFERWAEEDLNTAMQFLPYVLKDTEDKRAFFRGVAPQLLEQDPERLLGVTEEHWWQGQWDATIQAMNKVADSNIDLAAEFFHDTADGKQYPPTAGKIAGNLVEQRSLEEAEAFALSIERKDSRGYAMQAISNRLSRQDPAVAVEYIENMSDPDLRDYAIRGMIQRIAGGHPEETLAWTKTMQKGDARVSAVKHLVQQWNNPDLRKNLEDLETFEGLSNEERGIIQAALRE